MCDFSKVFPLVHRYVRRRIFSCAGKLASVESATRSTQFQTHHLQPENDDTANTQLGLAGYSSLCEEFQSHYSSRDLAAAKSVHAEIVT